jgi:D-hydroxyproline dehydrogenase subunit gamma
MTAPRPLLTRLAGGPRAVLAFELDGRPCSGLDGDTVLTAVLALGDVLRHSEFNAAPRAGFCLMGACQDCWVETETGQRLRACSTVLAPGMQLRTRAVSTP